MFSSDCKNIYEDMLSGGNLMFDFFRLFWALQGAQKEVA